MLRPKAERSCVGVAGPAVNSRRGAENAEKRIWFFNRWNVQMLPRDRFQDAEVTGIGMPDDDYPEKDLTQKIIGCAIAVHRELGAGYLEAIYENALGYELKKEGLHIERQPTADVTYDGLRVGTHRADLIVEGKVAVELKCVDILTDRDTAQLISTLKAFRLKVGLLLNFSEAKLRHGLRRVVLTKS